MNRFAASFRSELGGWPEGNFRVSIRQGLSALQLSEPWNLDPLFLGGFAELAQGASLDLPLALFGDAHFCANFLERKRLLSAHQPEATDKNLLLSIVKPLQTATNLPLALLLGVFMLVLVAPFVLIGSKHFLVAGAKPIAVPQLVGDRACKVFHNRPTGISAELVAAGKVKLLYRANQRHVSVA